MAESAAWVRSADATRAVEAAGSLLVECLANVTRESGRARLAVPGGSAASALGVARHELAGAPEVWRGLHLTWVDERLVSADDPESNRGMAQRAGWIGEPAEVLPLVLDGELPAAAVARVDRALDATFDGALDVVLLGMGEDGHIASLFPGLAPDPEALEARVAHVTSSPKPPAERITLTRRVLRTARRTILLATGEAKRPALARLADGDASLPAVGLPGLTVVTDLKLSREAER